MEKYFVVFGEACRGNDDLYGKEWMEGESEENIVLEVLKKDIFFGEKGVDSSYMEDYFDAEKPGVFVYSDDNGFYVYVGKSKEDVIDLWSEYL